MAHHTFTPDHYYTTIGWHQPVLAIAPGDSVSTTTVDARGQDQHGEQVTERGNPMTGPFYIEGAEQGDTLVVHFDRLYPNRDWGWTGMQIAPNVLDPGFATGIEADSALHRWAIDLEAGTTKVAALPGLELPLRPMLGCFGVAPPRGQAISTATSSTYGGNMDYRGFVEGVTVYLPVEAPGAFFISEMDTRFRAMARSWGPEWRFPLTRHLAWIYSKGRRSVGPGLKIRPIFLRWAMHALWISACSMPPANWCVGSRPIMDSQP